MQTKAAKQTAKEQRDDAKLRIFVHKLKSEMRRREAENNASLSKKDARRANKRMVRESEQEFYRFVFTAKERALLKALGIAA